MSDLLHLPSPKFCIGWIQLTRKTTDSLQITGVKKARWFTEKEKKKKNVCTNLIVSLLCGLASSQTNCSQYWNHVKDCIKRLKAILGVETFFACCAQSLQSCPTLWNPMDYSPPGSSALYLGKWTKECRQNTIFFYFIQSNFNESPLMTNWNYNWEIMVQMYKTGVGQLLKIWSQTLVCTTENLNFL